MVNELNTHMLRAGAPSPSVETILHAILPHKYVDHTHADAVLAISNAPDGEKRIREIYGERVVVIPYVMAGLRPGRVLRARVSEAGAARTPSAWCCSRTASSPSAPDARESYERMIELVSMAEEYLAAEEGLARRRFPAKARAGVQARGDREPAARDLRRRRASRWC